MKHETGFIVVGGVEVPESAVLRREPVNRYGSVPGLSDEELADPVELEGVFEVVVSLWMEAEDVHGVRSAGFPQCPDLVARVPLDPALREQVGPEVEHLHHPLPPIRRSRALDSIIVRRGFAL